MQIFVSVARRDEENKTALAHPLYMVFAHRKGARVHYCNSRQEADAMAARVRRFEEKRANQTKGANR